MTTTKRIISIDSRAVANVLACTYAILTTLGSISLFFTDAKQITYPIGFVVPGFNLNLNLTHALPENPFGRLFTMLGMVGSFIITGWISGYLLGGLVNLVARRLGGIPASIVEVEEVSSPATPMAPTS
jgi:hypothetical protein